MIHYYIPYALIGLIILSIGIFFFWLIIRKKTVVISIENESDKSYSKKDVLPFLLSTLSLFLSIFVLSYALPILADKEGLNYSYMDVIVAILTILITILLGWQIYNGIKFEEQVKIASDSAEKAASSEKLAKASDKTANDVLNEVNRIMNQVSGMLELAEKSEEQIKYSRQKVEAAVNSVNNIQKEVADARNKIVHSKDEAAKSAEIASQMKTQMEAVQKSLSEFVDKSNNQIEDNLKQAMGQVDKIFKKIKQIEETLGEI